MRTTLNIDDQLLAEAQRITGVSEKVALVREGLRALIERESARRLARLGGAFQLDHGDLGDAVGIGDREPAQEQAASDLLDADRFPGREERGLPDLEPAKTSGTIGHGLTPPTC